MVSWLLFAGSVVGAAGLFLLLRPGKRAMKTAGALVGLGAVAWMFQYIIGTLEGDSTDVVFYIFSFIAVAAAVRMITHSKPVYSALYFVLVVLSSASLFLLLEAEFMAFALIIVYAGAILITYLFVIMLAQQGPSEDSPQQQPEYDRIAREPFPAVVVGFIVLALLSTMIVNGTPQLQEDSSLKEQRAREAAWDDLESMPGQITSLLKDDDADFDSVAEAGDASDARVIKRSGETGMIDYVTTDGDAKSFDVTDEMLPDNSQRVGLALVADFPVSLELAGVILLMAMFGAVVLARKQIELSDDEKREAVGMSRLISSGDGAEEGAS